MRSRANALDLIAVVSNHVVVGAGGPRRMEQSWVSVKQSARA
jgi:hypothetical protein